jgi:hypothetical protein
VVIDGLGYVTIAAALVLAAWGGIAAQRDRAPERWLYGATGVVFALVAVQAVIALAGLIGGHDVDVPLFLGYLATEFLLLPAAVVLARMEPTRYGSAILAAGGLVIAPLVLRLLQIWTLH